MLTKVDQNHKTAMKQSMAVVSLQIAYLVISIFVKIVQSISCPEFLLKYHSIRKQFVIICLLEKLNIDEKMKNTNMANITY